MMTILRCICNVLFNIIKMFPKKYIIFESKPDYSDNSWAVYNYIKNNKLLNDYRLIWLVSNKNELRADIESIFYTKSLFSRLKVNYYLIRSSIIIFCNAPLSKARSDQKSIFLCHGSKSKKTRSFYGAPSDLDYILVQADIFKEAIKCEYNLSAKTKMIILGYPRNDDLLMKNSLNAANIFKQSFKKMIIWYPTFRQHKNGTMNVSTVCLPIIHNVESAKILNECAMQNDILIVLKPHFAQDMSYIKNEYLSNIRIIDDKFISEKNIRSYQLLSISDALLTDYSSVYYDYLLVDKPIGLIWEDYEEYKAKQGFALDPDLVYAGGEKIYDINNFCAFIERVAKGQDLLKAERGIIKDMTNVYQDEYSSKRVSEFIENLVMEEYKR